MRVNRRNVAVAGVIALAAAGVAQAWNAMAATGEPQLGLRIASPRLLVERIEGDPYVYAELGTYVGVTGAPLQVEALPAGDGLADLWLVSKDDRGTIKRIKKLETPGPAPMGSGLPDFVELSFKNSAGDVVSEQALSFCPSGGLGGMWGYGGGQARIDATGPAEPSTASSCGSHLTKRIVFGLDQGWAAPVGNDLLSNFTGEDGDYTVTMKIAQEYVEQFAIPADKATGSLTLTVKTVPCPWEPEWCGTGSGGGALTDSSGHAGHGSAATPSDGHAGGHASGHAATKLDPIVRAAAADVNAAAARKATLDSSPTLRYLQSKVHPQRTNRPDADRARRAGGLPDMVALPAFATAVQTDEAGRDQLSFGANIANLGSGPLVVEGYRVNDTTMTATQWEYRDGAPVRSFPAGEFEWDPREGHLHWHFEDVAQYDLVAADGSLTRSGKQAFCLAPTDAIDLTLPGAAQRVDTDRLWSACGGQTALWIREVLPAGWGDTYYQGLPGQAFDITDVPNGTYTIRVTTNFRNRLKESTTSNNVSTKKVELGGVPGARTVTEL